MVRLAEVSKATKFGKRRGEKEESEDWLGRSYKERTVRWAISELVSVTLPRGTRGHKNMELLVARVKEVKSRLRGVGAEQDFFAEYTTIGDADKIVSPSCQASRPKKRARFQ